MTQLSAEARLLKKQAFFDELDAVSDEDEVTDNGLQASVAALKKAQIVQDPQSSHLKNSLQLVGLPSAGTARTVRRPTTSGGDQGPASEVAQNSLSRSASDPNLAHSKVDRGMEKSHALLKEAALPAALKQRHTATGALESAVSAIVPASAIPRASGKRKRDSSIALVPENQRLFNGLHFYFFPNNDVHPARRMRIIKALEFGATWQKEWNQHVTHLIVDKVMNLGQVTAFLRIEALPPHVEFVNEGYPAECISYRMLLDPKQPQYKVKGYLGNAISANEVNDSRPVSAHSDVSLKLKPAGKDVMARLPETPAPTEDPSRSLPRKDEPDNRISPTTAPSIVPLAPEKPHEEAFSTEEFNEAIRRAKELQHVPLDHEDEPASRPTSSEGPDTDDEDHQAPFQFLKKKKNKFARLLSKAEKFQCMQKHTADDGKGPNAATVAILQQMADYYGQMGDEWRVRAYRKAMATLRTHPTKVCTKEEAQQLPYVGERLAAKIEEIVYTNRLRRLDNACAEPTDEVLQNFMKIYGVGFSQASKWVGQGYKSIEELLEKASLNDNQKIGITHYDDFNSRIPRAEVEKHGETVRQALLKMDPAFQIIVGGSYRRGAETSGDIDCIITRPDTGTDHIRNVVCDQLVPELFAKGFLTAALAVTSQNDGTKWHGASCLPGSGTWRRIDFLLVPWDEMGAALIYFTGNDIFNRSLRLLASTKGMTLNQRGLYRDVMRGKGREKLTEGTLVEGRDEKRIFEVLGVPWRPPEHRIC